MPLFSQRRQYYNQEEDIACKHYNCKYAKYKTSYGKALSVV